jgi:hypothetical protein
MVPGADSFVANGIVVHNCHIYTTTTGAMKNAFGGLLNTKRHYTHSWIHATLVDLLAIQKEIHAGLFAVMDGTTAGDGPGPRTMRPVIKNVMLAGADQVAIDAVAAAMMGFEPMSLEYIRLADEQGLGNGRRENIEVVGDAHLADERWGFSVGDNGASRVGDVMWFGPLKRFQKLFFHTPLVNLFVMGSEAYHDWWPLRRAGQSLAARNRLADCSTTTRRTACSVRRRRPRSRRRVFGWDGSPSSKTPRCAPWRRRSGWGR